MMMIIIFGIISFVIVGFYFTINNRGVVSIQNRPRILKNQFCTSCGDSLEIDTAFCSNCGTKVK